MEIHVPKYDRSLKLDWEDQFTIQAKITGAYSVVIKADKGGLISLARHLLTLAQDNVPAGCHVHLDESNSLEEGSCEIILERD
ncbi:hypothetical protein KDK_24910 [Dictyobacter kobayashii]|uniref:Uncharacterized protein n=1 Tax=Dictyobacter kobayashii TaxID=2014872 RepID=A0A402AHU0_9CHLR|nr:hypothetical protein KDK_24910 [Dictyobacter kobayashii]